MNKISSTILAKFLKKYVVIKVDVVALKDATQLSSAEGAIGLVPDGVTLKTLNMVRPLYGTIHVMTRLLLVT